MSLAVEGKIENGGQISLQATVLNTGGEEAPKPVATPTRTMVMINKDGSRVTLQVCASQNQFLLKCASHNNRFQKKPRLPQTYFGGKELRGSTK